MENTEDIKANIRMYFEQIINLCDLSLNSDEFNLATTLTLRDLAKNGLDKASCL